MLNVRVYVGSAAKRESLLARISHLDPADTPEGRGNPGEPTDYLFHPSRPSGFGYLL
jgi:hypothetical protein